MNQPNERAAVIKAAGNIETKADARRLIDALHAFGVAWHPEESFAGIYPMDGDEPTFSEEEARQLDKAIKQVEQILGSAGMYACTMEIQFADADKTLLYEAGIDSIRRGPRRVPATPDSKVDFHGAIPVLLKHAGHSCDKTDDDNGFVIRGPHLQVWEAEEPDVPEGMTKWSFAIADIDSNGNVVDGTEHQTQSASLFMGEVETRIARELDAATPAPAE